MFKPNHSQKHYTHILMHNGKQPTSLTEFDLECYEEEKLCVDIGIFSSDKKQSQCACAQLDLVLALLTLP